METPELHQEPERSDGVAVEVRPEPKTLKTFIVVVGLGYIGFLVLAKLFTAMPLPEVPALRRAIRPVGGETALIITQSGYIWIVATCKKSTNPEPIYFGVFIPPALMVQRSNDLATSLREGWGKQQSGFHREVR